MSCFLSYEEIKIKYDNLKEEEGVLETEGHWRGRHGDRGQRGG